LNHRQSEERNLETLLASNHGDYLAVLTLDCDREPLLRQAKYS